VIRTGAGNWAEICSFKFAGLPGDVRLAGGYFQLIGGNLGYNDRHIPPAAIDVKLEIQNPAGTLSLEADPHGLGDKTFIQSLGTSKRTQDIPMRAPLKVVFGGTSAQNPLATGGIASLWCKTPSRDSGTVTMNPANMDADGYAGGTQGVIAGFSYLGGGI
jgi:hypothetical protein